MTLSASDPLLRLSVLGDTGGKERGQHLDDARIIE
jgi:hypothetical protein